MQKTTNAPVDIGNKSFNLNENALKCVFIKVWYFSEFVTYFFKVLPINVRGLHTMCVQIYPRYQRFFLHCSANGTSGKKEKIYEDELCCLLRER